MSADAIAALERLQRSLEAALSTLSPAVVLPTEALVYHRQGLRAGLQMAIEAATTEIDTLRLVHGNTDITALGIEAARTFDQDHHKSQ